MSELRQDPWSGEWISFSDHRQARPLEGADGWCPFCPGDPADHEVADRDWDVMVFENRFPALGGPATWPLPHPGYASRPARGHAEVVLYAPDHEAELGSLGVERVARVIEVWADRSTALARDPEVQSILVFENRGREVGATIAHPHGQIYAYPFVPSRIVQQMRAAEAFTRSSGLCLGCEVVARELKDGRRVLAQDAHVLVHVPFAPRFPYEVHLLPRRHVRRLAELSAAERRALAAQLCRLVARYDRLFGFKLPYVMLVHEPPVRGPLAGVAGHLRIAFLPPHRAADRLKVVAGSELGAGAFLTDVLPEVAAERLRQAGS